MDVAARLDSDIMDLDFYLKREYLLNWVTQFPYIVFIIILNNVQLKFILPFTYHMC